MKKSEKLKENMITAKCELCINPVGIDIEKPVFSWEISPDEKPFYQKGYRITVKSGNVTYWDTGYVESETTTNIEYEGLVLENLKKYEWYVDVTNEFGEEFSSDNSFFVTGLLDPSSIKGSWIEHPALHDNPIFYSDFFVRKNLEEAYVIISGLGYYDMKINGTRAHDSYNVPAWTDYCERDLSGLLYPYDNKSEYSIMYNVHDVTSYLKEGINRYEVMLGNGFFNQFERLIEGDMSYGTPRLLLEMHLRYKDGTESVVLSNEETFCTDGSLEFNNIYFGEKRNENIGLDFSGTTTAALCEWTPGVLRSQYDFFDKITEIIVPTDIGSGLYDAGKNISGRVRVNASGPRGAQFIIEYSDALDDDGNPDFRSTGGEWQIQENQFVFGSENEIDYAETFGWRGFRYFKIEKDSDVNINNLKVEVIHTDCPSKGSFKCDNETINWIHDAYVRTQEANMHGGVPSDCPHRERLGYTGDGQVTASATAEVLGAVNFLKKWNSDIILSQNTESGFIPHTVPFSGGGGGPAWGSACAVIPNVLYNYTHDRRIVHDSYKTIQKWIEFLEKQNPELIIEREIEGSWCLGDWCIPVEGYEVEKIDLEGIFRELDPKLVNTCYYYHCVKICMEFGGILSRDTIYYERLATRIKNSFNEKFLDYENSVYSDGKHYANVYPLFFDMVPDSEKEKVFLSLINEIENQNFAMDCGIFATSMIFEVLAESGNFDVIEKMLLNKEYPSFGYMKDKGATTLWETWDGSASLNHPMFGGAVPFLYKYPGGIRYIGQNGMVLIEPVFLSVLKEAEASRNTEFGRITVAWKRSSGKDGENIITVDVTLPGNIRGAFRNGENSLIIGNGTNKITVNETTGILKKVVS